MKGFARLIADGQRSNDSEIPQPLLCRCRGTQAQRNSLVGSAVILDVLT